MSLNKIHFPLLLLLLSLLPGTTSCELFRHAAGEDALPHKRSVRFLNKKLEQLQPEFNTLSAKLKIDAQLPDQHLKLTASLRMKRDSAIWMNFKKFGIEMGRMLITPDSAFFINRLDRTYFAERLEDLAKAFQIPADFGQLQSLLIGYPLSAEQAELSLVPGAYLLIRKGPELEDTLRLAAGSFLPEKWSIFHPNSGLSAQMSFDNYQKLDKQHFFSYFRVLEAAAMPGEDMQIALEFAKLTLNEEVNMSFRIPGHYERTR